VTEPDAQQSLLPATPTGQPRVDAALSRLDELASLPVHDHVATYEQVHQVLTETLADRDPV
jgi:hypothetical protein